ncbi:MAG TPA: hypothetical protein VM912_00895, partial [Terriglobales bacterium]|nr:hypothetical protein [Terriglobales bacterium]
MPRTYAVCGLAQVAQPELCNLPSTYRVEVRSIERKAAVLYLCSTHIHRAWHLGQLALDKKFPGQNFVVKSIHLHEL